MRFELSVSLRCAAARPTNDSTPWLKRTRMRRAQCPHGLHRPLEAMVRLLPISVDAASEQVKYG